MRTVAGLAAAAVLLTGAWSAGAQPETESPSSPFVLASERGHDDPRFAGANTPIMRLLADAQEAQARDGRPGRVGPPGSDRASEREEGERVSRRGPAEAREAMRRVRIDRIARTLGMDEQETEEVVERLEAHEEEHRELQRELWRARRALRQALRDNEDEDAISEKLEEALDLEVQKIRHRGAGYREMTEGFDVKQQARFYLFVPEFEEDMRQLVERARAMRGMDPRVHERLREMGPQEQREFFREHGLYPGRRDEAPDERRRERPEARREEREERPRLRGEEEREALRRRLERMAETMGEEEAERWRERVERMFDFVSEDVPEAWRQRVQELREQWLEGNSNNSDNNSDEAEPRARRGGAQQERPARVRDDGRERLRELREDWPEMSRSERREAMEDRFRRLDDVTEEDVRRFVRRGPDRSFPRVGVEVPVYGAPRMERLRELREDWPDMSPSERREAIEERFQRLDGVTEEDVRRFVRRGPDGPLPRVSEREMERLRELRERWADMSPSERREAIEERFQRLDGVTEEDVRRFVRRGPDRSFPRVGVDVRVPDAPRLSEQDMETLRELREGWADMSRSERRELLERVAQPLDDVTEEDLRRFLREGPDARFPRVGVDVRPRRMERPREREQE